ncbi:MAG: DUF2190 family protein [Nitrospiraceae bacterium]|nr:DUF2190 family protein [Nitrospiraceae bacterium]
MRDTIIKKLGKRGLVLAGLLYGVMLLCIATVSPLAASMGLMPLFGMATATASDSMLNVRTLPHTHNSGLNSGDIIVYNSSVLVAVNKTDANVENVFCYQGKMTFPKEANLVINPFDQVYWDAGNGVITKTSAGNTQCGFCVEAAAAADTTVVMMLVPGVAVLDLAQSSANAIADPGNAQAIPVTASGVVEIVTAAAETRTLAAPSFLGQLLVLDMKTDGGDCVITCATTVNQTLNNTVTLNDAGDAVTLIAKSNGANLRWSVLANDGATLSTV